MQSDLRLIWRLTLFSLKARYRKTYAGFIWVVINPLLMYGAQGLVFKYFLKINIDNYMLFLLGGLLPWTFIVSCLNSGTSLFQSQARILKSFDVNPFVLICSQILDNTINFLAAFFLILIPLVIFGQTRTPGLFLLPISLVILVSGTIALTSICAILQVFYRDTRFVIPFLTSILFFLTPIFYPRELVPSNFQWAVDWNPIYILIQVFRSVIYDYSIYNFVDHFIKSTALSGLLIVMTYFYWKYKRNEFYLFL